MTQANEPELSSDGGGEGAVDNRSHSLREDPSGEWHPLVPPPPPYARLGSRCMDSDLPSRKSWGGVAPAHTTPNTPSRPPGHETCTQNS